MFSAAAAGMVLALTTAANAGSLMCQIKAVSGGDQERRVSITLPEKSGYHYELGLIDRRNLSVEMLGGKEDFLGEVLPRGVGWIELQTKNIYGEWSEAKGSKLIVVNRPDVNKQIDATFFRPEKLSGGFQALVTVDLADPNRTMTMADAVHLPGQLTLFRGPCLASPQ